MCNVLNFLEEMLNKAEILQFHAKNHHEEVSASSKTMINFTECYKLSIPAISFIIFIFLGEKFQAADGIANIKL